MQFTDEETIVSTLPFAEKPPGLWLPLRLYHRTRDVAEWLKLENIYP
jgi:hypothetical protein